MKILAPLDLTQNEIRNAVLHNLGGAPASPKKGQPYFNTVSNVAYVWVGNAWRPTDAAALTDGSIPNAALETNPLARANHTGTQAASTISDFGQAVTAYRLDQMAAPTATVSLNGRRISNLASPTEATDAASKDYVDGAIQSAAAGIDSKGSVRVIATDNITLTGLQTIDGITVAAGDRVLVVGQTTAQANGAYVAAAGVWSRATDADQVGEINPGAFWFVEEGGSYGKTQWRCATSGVINIGTTAIAIEQFGAASMYSNGFGLKLTGTVFAVLLDAASGLVSSGTGLKIDTTIVARKFAATIVHDGVASSFAVQHDLGTKDVVVSVRDAADNGVMADWTATSANAIAIGFGSAQTAGTAFRVIVQG